MINDAKLMASICQKVRHSSASVQDRDEALRDASEMLRKFASLDSELAEALRDTLEELECLYYFACRQFEYEGDGKDVEAAISRARTVLSKAMGDS